MIGDTFKDLRRGDKVKYDYKEYYTKERKTGKGVIYGFGHLGESDFVWVKEADGIHPVPYDGIEKI